MNIRHAKKMFDDLNAKYFFSLLPCPRFVKYSGMTGTDATVACSGEYIDGIIYYHRKLSRRQLRATIAHEMIHQYQDFSGWFSNENGHGKEFTDTAAYIAYQEKTAI